MKKWKNFVLFGCFSLFLAVVVNFFPNSAVSFADFKDVSEDTRYSEAIEYVEKMGIVNGYEDGSFQPEKLVNRAEFAKIVAKGLFPVTDFSQYTNCFPDIPAGVWYEGYACKLKEEGIFSGTGAGNFEGERNINVVEVSKVIILAFEIKKDWKVFDQEAKNRYQELDFNQWYAEPLAKMSENSLLAPDFIGLTEPVDRGQMAEMISRALSEEKEIDEQKYLVRDLVNNQKKLKTGLNILVENDQSSGSCFGGGIYNEKFEKISVNGEIELSLKCLGNEILSPDNKFLYYLEADLDNFTEDGLKPTFFINSYSFGSGEIQRRLMTFYEDFDGFSFGEWSPNGKKLSMVVINQENPDYPYGTKFFVLELENGKIVEKLKYDVPVYFVCGSVCSAEADFGFVDDDTIYYHDSVRDDFWAPTGELIYKTVDL